MMRGPFCLLGKGVGRLMSGRMPGFRLAAVLALLAAMSLSGCGGAGPGGTFNIHLDSYAEHIPYGKRFVVLQGIMDVKPGDPDFKAAAEILAKAVEAKGYVQAESLEQADLGLYLAYHVTESSRSPFENFQPRSPWGVTNNIVWSEYIRDIVVEAVDMARYKAGDPRNIVWKVHAASKGPTSDIRKSMPAIAAAVAQYMGTSGEVYVEVYSDLSIHPYKPKPNPHNRP